MRTRLLSNTAYLLFFVFVTSFSYAQTDTLKYENYFPMLKSQIEPLLNENEKELLKNTVIAVDSVEKFVYCTSVNGINYIYISKVFLQKLYSMSSLELIEEMYPTDKKLPYLYQYLFSAVDNDITPFEALSFREDEIVNFNSFKLMVDLAQLGQIIVPILHEFGHISQNHINQYNSLLLLYNKKNTLKERREIIEKIHEIEVSADEYVVKKLFEMYKQPEAEARIKELSEQMNTKSQTSDMILALFKNPFSVSLEFEKIFTINDGKTTNFFERSYRLFNSTYLLNGCSHQNLNAEKQKRCTEMKQALEQMSNFLFTYRNMNGENQEDKPFAIKDMPLFDDDNKSIFKDCIEPYFLFAISSLNGIGSEKNLDTALVYIQKALNLDSPKSMW